MLLVERWILAVLRNRTFCSLSELNWALSELLERLNARALQKLPGCRRSAFESIDLPALRALPSTAYEVAQWKKVRVHIDHHIESAPKESSVVVPARQANSHSTSVGKRHPFSADSLSVAKNS